MRVWAKAKVLHGLASILGATEQDDIGAGWGTHGQLVESEALTARFLNASTCGRCKAKGTDAHLRHLVQAVVIGNGTDHRADLALGHLHGAGVVRDSYNLGERDGGLVDFRRHKTTENGFVEVAVGAAGEELVKLHQQSSHPSVCAINETFSNHWVPCVPQVWILALWGLAMAAAHCAQYISTVSPIQNHRRLYLRLNRSELIAGSHTVVLVQVDTHFDGFVVVEWRVCSSRVQR